MPKTDSLHVRIGPEEREALNAIRAWLGERQLNPTNTDAVCVALRRFADSVQTLKNNRKKPGDSD